MRMRGHEDCGRKPSDWANASEGRDDSPNSIQSGAHQPVRRGPPWSQSPGPSVSPHPNTLPAPHASPGPPLLAPQPRSGVQNVVPGSEGIRSPPWSTPYSVHHGVAHNMSSPNQMPSTHMPPSTSTSPQRQEPAHNTWSSNRLPSSTSPRYHDASMNRRDNGPYKPASPMAPAVLAPPVAPLRPMPFRAARSTFPHSDHLLARELMRPPKYGGVSKRDMLGSIAESWGPDPSDPLRVGLFQHEPEPPSPTASPVQM